MFEDLYREARAATVVAADELAHFELASEAAFVAQVEAAQDALVAELVEGAPAKIRAAAARGQDHASLLDWVGPEKYNPAGSDEPPRDADLCYLFLVKGPREPDHVPGCLPRLRKALAPFRVRHDWNQANNLNSVIVSWSV
jgi:hypothetical protein